MPHPSTVTDTEPAPVPLDNEFCAGIEIATIANKAGTVSRTKEWIMSDSSTDAGSASPKQRDGN
jgi:hypothetical protein